MVILKSTAQQYGFLSCNARSKPHVGYKKSILLLCRVWFSALFLTRLLILVGVSSKACPKEADLVEDSCIFTVYSKGVVK